MVKMSDEKCQCSAQMKELEERYFNRVKPWSFRDVLGFYELSVAPLRAYEYRMYRMSCDVCYMGTRVCIAQHQMLADVLWRLGVRVKR